jgi:copper chaperone
MEKIIVQNLKCNGCATSITQKLSAVDFVKDVQVSPEEKTVQVQLTDASQLDEVKRMLAKLGYPEENQANSISTKAKSFVSCAVGKIS